MPNNPQTSPQRPVLRAVCRLITRLLGWRTETNFPETPRYVLVFAPHTSNWDFIVGLLVAFSIDFWPHWIGKHTLFRPPMGWIMRKLGGIPVDRTARHNFVDQVADLLQTSEPLVIAVAPEGTRRKTDRWRTGFYYIALKANVPIALAYLDYKRKVGGVGAAFMPAGDLEADFAIIRAFYKDITGKNPDQQGEIVFRTTTE